MSELILKLRNQHNFENSKHISIVIIQLRCLIYQVNSQSSWPFVKIFMFINLIPWPTLQSVLLLQVFSEEGSQNVCLIFKFSQKSHFHNSRLSFPRKTFFPCTYSANNCVKYTSGVYWIRWHGKCVTNKDNADNIVYYTSSKFLLYITIEFGRK